MRWQIENFIFCERQQNLTLGEQVQQLEPMVVELLVYFCNHTDQIISRDQLIEQVWCGRIITDNAVSKAITKLRKYLNDDPKKPRFIATFPKKGYKFIASVSPVNEVKAEAIKTDIELIPGDVNKTSQNRVQPETISVKNNKKLLSQRALLILILLVSIIAVVVVWPFNNEPQTFTQVKALTRDSGRESKPQVSPDGQYLAYTESRDKKMRQWIKDLNSQTSIEVSHGESNNIWVDSAAWNSDGSKFVYLVTTSDSCRYFIREFKAMTLGEPELIHNCPSGSYGKIAYTHDDNRVVYTENEGRNTPFTLFEMNLTTGVKRKLNQPEIFLGGNSQFDLHPSQNKLLISSPDRQQWEGFYSLDLKTDELKLLFKQDAFICCGRWSHNGERVVLMGEHPANQLVSFNLQGKDKQVIYTGSEQARVPERHTNGKDYLFPIIHLNRNANYHNLDTTVTRIIANSSVDDRLATFAHHDNELVAYISLSSGTEEVWLTDSKGKHHQKMTDFKDSRHYIELLWSYNGKSLLGITLNEIHLIDNKTGLSQVLKIPQVEIRGVSWKNDQTVSYSIKDKDGWRVQYYNIETHQVKAEADNWQYIRYAQKNDDIIWQDSTEKLYFGAKPQEILDTDLQQVELLNSRIFNLKKIGPKWAWQKRSNGRYQLMIKENSKLRPPLNTDSFYFDISNKGVLFHTLESSGSDIYQTVSE